MEMEDLLQQLVVVEVLVELQEKFFFLQKRRMMMMDQFLKMFLQLYELFLNMIRLGLHRFLEW